MAPTKFANQHIVMVAWPAIGHARPMLDFAKALLLDYQGLYLTFICSTSQIARMKGLNLLDGAFWANPINKRRLRLLAVGAPAAALAPAAPTQANGAPREDVPDAEVVITMKAAVTLSMGFSPVFAKLYAGEPVVAADDGAVLPPPGVPLTAVICNWMIQGVPKQVKAIAPEVRILSFFDHSAFFATRLLGPTSIGGFGNIAADWAAYVEKTGCDANDKNLLEKTFGRRSHGTYEIPGLGIDVIHEDKTSPQAKEYLMNVPVTPSLLQIQELVAHSDAMLINSNEAVEGDVLAYLRSVVSCKVITINSLMLRDLVEGMQKPPRSLIEGAYSATSEEERFLVSHPANSVIYISFGTMFRPTAPQLLVMLEILVKEHADIPFLWSLGGGRTLVEALAGEDEGRIAEVASAIEASPNAKVCSWVDQHAVLTHPSVGWFLSHGGWNSALECLHAAKPMLVFPFFGDQLWTAHLLRKRGTALQINSSRHAAPTAFAADFAESINTCRSGHARGEVIKSTAQELGDRVMEERLASRSGQRCVVWKELSTVLPVQSAPSLALDQFSPVATSFHLKTPLSSRFDGNSTPLSPSFSVRAA